MNSAHCFFKTRNRGARKQMARDRSNQITRETERGSRWQGTGAIRLLERQSVETDGEGQEQSDCSRDRARKQMARDRSNQIAGETESGNRWRGTGAIRLLERQSEGTDGEGQEQSDCLRDRARKQ